MHERQNALANEQLIMREINTFPSSRVKIIKKIIAVIKLINHNLKHVF